MEEPINISRQCESISHARKELTKFFDRYNMRRPHQGLADMTPDHETLQKIKDAV